MVWRPSICGEMTRGSCPGAPGNHTGRGRGCSIRPSPASTRRSTWARPAGAQRFATNAKQPPLLPGGGSCRLGGRPISTTTGPSTLFRPTLPLGPRPSSDRKSRSAHIGLTSNEGVICSRRISSRCAVADILDGRGSHIPVHRVRTEPDRRRIDAQEHPENCVCGTKLLWPTPTSLMMVTATLWDLRSQCEQQLRSLTDAQRLADELRARPGTGTRGPFTRQLLATLQGVLRSHDVVREATQDCLQLVCRLAEDEASQQT